MDDLIKFKKLLVLNKVTLEKDADSKISTILIGNDYDQDGNSVSGIVISYKNPVKSGTFNIIKIIPIIHLEILRAF